MALSDYLKPRRPEYTLYAAFDGLIHARFKDENGQEVRQFTREEAERILLIESLFAVP